MVISRQRVLTIKHRTLSVGDVRVFLQTPLGAYNIYVTLS